MKVVVKSKLAHAPEKVWDLLTLTSTLCYVAEGVMTYDTADTIPKKWRIGDTMNLRPRLWGKLQGDHFVIVEDVNDKVRRIVTHEYGGHITKWQHTMDVLSEGKHCLLIDTIEIEAGWRTPIIWLFAQFFYRHRHKRWPGLLAQQ